MKEKEQDNGRPGQDKYYPGNKYPWVKDCDLIQVIVGTKREGSTIRTPTQFILPKRYRR